MDRVQEVTDKLLGVVLAVALEHTMKVAKFVLKLIGRNHPGAPMPHLEHKISISVQNFALRA